MVPRMQSMTRIRLATLALALAAAPALAQEVEEVPPELRIEEAPPELRVEVPTLDPFQEKLALAANPLLPEDEAQTLFDELVASGDLAVPAMVTTFRDAQSGDQENWIAARALGRIGGPTAIRTLSAGLDSPRIITRLGAVSGLSLISSKETVPALERALFDRAMTVRAYSADALALIGSRKSSVALSKALNLPANFHHGRSHFVRMHIVEALGNIGSIGGIDALIGVLGEEEEPLQIAASMSLEKITGISFRPLGTDPMAAPTPAEVAQWQAWWSQRSVGEIAD